jgi:hypothetical protein
MLRNIFWILISVVFLVTLDGCKKSCGLNCLHGGSCNGNTCSCPDPYSGNNCDTMCTLGYEGYNCQTLSKTRFFGTWSCTSKDQSGNSSTYLITFTNNTSANEFMNLNNFNNAGGSHPIVCTMSGKYKFDINLTDQDATNQAAGVSGYANLNNGKITLYLNTSTNNYFANATRQ